MAHSLIENGKRRNDTVKGQKYGNQPVEQKKKEDEKLNKKNEVKRKQEEKKKDENTKADLKKGYKEENKQIFKKQLITEKSKS